jgi:hypothetical protein
MKVTIKRNLIIFHWPGEWETLQSQLRQDYGHRIMLSWVCKRELGFTVRRHKGLEPHPEAEWEVMRSQGWNHRYHYQEQIHLDFYDPAQQTWFVLKYLDTCVNQD